MKIKIIVLFVLIASVLNGCLIKSIHPFYREKDVLYNKTLLGKWIDSENALWEISQYRIFTGVINADSLDNSFYVKYTAPEDSAISIFNVHYFELDGTYYLDFFPILDEIMDDVFYRYNLIPCHTIARINHINDAKIIVQWFDEDWLSELFEQNRIKISHEVVQESENFTQYLLTGSTSELQKFLVKYGHDPKLFKALNDPEEVKECEGFALVLDKVK